MMKNKKQLWFHLMKNGIDVSMDAVIQLAIRHNIGHKVDGAYFFDAITVDAILKYYKLRDAIRALKKQIASTTDLATAADLQIKKIRLTYDKQMALKREYMQQQQQDVSKQ